MYCLASGPCSVVILIIDLCNAMDYYNTSIYILCVCGLLCITNGLLQYNYTSIYCVCVDYYVLLMDYYNIIILVYTVCV